MSRAKNPELIKTGNNIRRKREAVGFSQDQLAEKMDLSKNTIHRYEAGQVQMGVTVLYKFADALHTTPNELAPDRFIGQLSIGSDSDKQASINKMWLLLSNDQKEVAYATIKAMLDSMIRQNKKDS